MAAVSEVFACPAALYVRQAAGQRLRKWLVPALAVLAALAVAACYDIRFAYLLLMAALIVYPMALTFAWIVLTGSKAFTLATRPQRWIMGGTAREAVTVEYFRFDCDRENPGRPVEKVAIAADQIEGISRSKGYTVVRTRSKATPLLIIPTQILNSIAL